MEIWQSGQSPFQEEATAAAMQLHYLILHCIEWSISASRLMGEEGGGRGYHNL